MNINAPGAQTPFARRTLLTALGTASLATLAACTGIGTPTPSSTAIPYPSHTGTPGPIARGQLASQATGDTRDWIIYYPPGAKLGDKLPVAIALHGLGDTLAMPEAQHYSAHLADAVASGVTPYAIAAIDGGALFWQKMGNQDAGALVATDFVALLKQRGLDTSRLALTGWSMGGWGTLRLACDELHGKLRAVAALSTPCYASSDQVPDNTWMTAAEFDSNNFYNRTDRLTGLPIFLACGASDEFYPGNVSFVERLTSTAGVSAPVTDFGPGGHSKEYWESVVPAQFRFLGEHI